MSSSSNPPVKTVRQEILDLAATLADSQTRLQQLVGRLDGQETEEETKHWKSRCRDLEDSYKEAVNSAKWLRTQNAELERRADQLQREAENAVLAREGAFRVIHHGRKVIRDLLAERADMGSPRQGNLTREEIEDALSDELNRDGESTSSDSDKTVRIQPRSPASEGHTTFDTPQGYPYPLSPIRSVASSNASSSRSTARFPYPSSPQTVLRLSPPSQGPSSYVDRDLAIHFKKPPGSSPLCEGPLSWADLERAFRLDVDMMNSLRSLATSSGMSMGLQIFRLPTNQTLAFLYDPIFADDRQESFILDWGKLATNQGIERYISKYKQKDDVFHTFTFPMIEKNWFYIGAHHWSIANLAPFWPLEGKSRGKLINKLCARTKGEVGQVEMERLLNSSEELGQFTVELTRVADTKVSFDFAQRMLGRVPPYPESKHEHGAKA